MKRPEPAGHRSGYIATAVGGLGGAALGAFVGWLAAAAYGNAALTNDSSSWDAIGFAFLVVPLATLLGAALGAWAALRIKGYERAGWSGFIFALLLALLIPAIAGLGSALLPVDIGIVPAGVILVSLLAALSAALITRLVARARATTSSTSPPSP